MRLPLPGTPLPLLGYRLDAPYSVHEDGQHLHLCFGSEDLVRTFDQAVMVDTVALWLRIDKSQRCLIGLMPERFGLPA